MSEERGTVSCRHCGFVWHSHDAAVALATVGECVRCHGPLSFHERAVAGEERPDPGSDVPPFLVLGRPRLQF